ncbi:hypothetical protein [Pseudonocardia sp.]|uniref:hypothetical protein n=1 Tax=Pseudonocardia sp. TaxID=60912 RepID=UPI003D0F3E47
MGTAVKLAAYAAVVVLLGAGAYAAGSTVGPQAGPPATPPPAAAHTESHAGAGVPAAEAGPPAGLASSAGGYSLVPLTPVLPAAAPTELAFRVTGPDGSALTRFAVAHDKRMHLILARTDTAGFQHLHPEMGPDGTWRTPVTLPAGGSYRAFADFVPEGGPPTTLGVLLSAPGAFTPIAPAPSRVATVDGYAVRLDGELTPGSEAPLVLTVTKDGLPVTDLPPYLGAYGHLVALRAGDLAYLHVHPDGAATPGPEIRFVAEVPSADTYRLFLDFAHAGTVRTAEFTVATSGLAPAAPHADDGHGH